MATQLLWRWCLIIHTSSSFARFNKRVLKTLPQKCYSKWLQPERCEAESCCDICTEVLGLYDFITPGETSSPTSVTSPSRSAYSADSEIPDHSSSTLSAIRIAEIIVTVINILIWPANIGGNTFAFQDWWRQLKLHVSVRFLFNVSQTLWFYFGIRLW